MTRVNCPFPEHKDAFIELPDKWTGEHAKRHDDAAEIAKAAKMPGTWRDFSVSMALLDNWQLPGLNGNVEKWDFNEIELPIMAWVKTVTLDAYYRNFIIPKNS